MCVSVACVHVHVCESRNHSVLIVYGNFSRLPGDAVSVDGVLGVAGIVQAQTQVKGKIR